MTVPTASRGRTARKVLGSLGVIGAAAAVAGMGTFGTFSDSTTPLDASVQSGTLKLDLTGPGNSATLPLAATAFAPGDSISRPVDLMDKGTLEMSTITLSSTPTPATALSILNKDTTNGLQLNVSSCPENWVQQPDRSWTCSTPATPLVNGPAVISNSALPNAASLVPNHTDHLLVTLSLPTTADNTFQNQSSVLQLTFTGTQRTATQH